MDSLVSGVRALPQPERVTSVGSVAEALHHIAGAMSDTQVMTVGESIVGWVGQSAGAFAHEARHIQAAVRKVQGAIANVIAALNEYQSVCNGLTQQIRSHQQNWDSNIAWYKKEVSEIQSQVGAASGGQFPLLDAVDGVEVAKAALRARLDERQADEARAYNKTVEAVDAAAASTAGKLRAALDAVVPGVTGPDGARGVPSRAAVGLALFGGTKGILAAQSRWAAAEADAPAAAELINRIDGKTKLPSQAALRQFNATYGARLASDPYFATMLMREIGAEKLCSIGSRIAGRADLSDSHKAQLKAFTASMGAGLILATGGSSTTDTDTTTGFKALDTVLTVDGKKTIRQWRSDFQAALNKYGQTSYDYEGNVISARNGVKMSLFGYEVFGQYLGQGARAHPELSVGDHFLNGVDGKNSVAKAMVKWDAENPVNFRLNNVTTGSGYGGGKSEDSGMFKDGLSWDYLQNMYEAMDNAPDKAPARTFMNSKLEWVDKWPDNEPGEPRHREMNMTRYLVGNRTQVGKVGSSALYWAEDKGAALGTLIEDLSSDTSKAKSVNIAREFIKGYNDGLDRNYDGWQIGNQDKEKGQDVFGYMNSNLRSHIGGILKEYTGDLAHELNDYTGVKNGPGASWDPRDKRYHLVLDKDLYEKLDSSDSKFFTDIAADKHVLKTMTIETMNKLANEYNQALNAKGDTDAVLKTKENIVSDYKGFLANLDNGQLKSDINAMKAHNSSIRTAGKLVLPFKASLVGGIIDYAAEHIGSDDGINKSQKHGIAPFIKDGVNFVLGLSVTDKEAEAKSLHIRDGVNRTAKLNEALTEFRRNFKSGIVNNDIVVDRAPTVDNGEEYKTKLQDYNSKLPDDEKFLDSGGKLPVDPATQRVKFDSLAKEQAYKRFNLDMWTGQGGASETPGTGPDN